MYLLTQYRENFSKQGRKQRKKYLRKNEKFKC